jgi:hypothetical protein
MFLQYLAANPILNHIGSVVTAVGALGTASFGIVDATKSIFGGVSTRGFASIEKQMATLLPDTPVDSVTKTDTSEPATPPALKLESILTSLKSNWINGVAQDDQVAIAKSLVKLRLNAALAPSLAKLTGVDATTLASVSTKIASGKPLDPSETDVYGRFDLVLTTVLDQAYQRGDQQYRNTAKILAGFVSIALAVSGNAALGDNTGHGFAEAILIGLLSTPLAPVAKDVASAIQAGANAVQSWRS